MYEGEGAVERCVELKVHTGSLSTIFQLLMKSEELRTNCALTLWALSGALSPINLNQLLATRDNSAHIKTQWSRRKIWIWQLCIWRGIHHLCCLAAVLWCEVSGQNYSIIYYPCPIVIIHSNNKNSTCHLAFVYLSLVKVPTPNIQMWATF